MTAGTRSCPKFLEARRNRAEGYGGKRRARGLVGLAASGATSFLPRDARKRPRLVGEIGWSRPPHKARADARAVRAHVRVVPTIRFSERRVHLVAASPREGDSGARIKAQAESSNQCTRSVRRDPGENERARLPTAG